MVAEAHCPRYAFVIVRCDGEWGGCGAAAVAAVRDRKFQQVFGGGVMERLR